MMREEYIWYACYGSNLSRSRFYCYLQGGKCEYNGKVYGGCADKRVPVEDRPIEIPHRVYFGNMSRSWGNGGVAFLEPQLTLNAKTKGRMYLITTNQFRDIYTQEGSGPNWYDALVDLGQSDGYPILTFTNSLLRPFNIPTRDYFRAMADGLAETYPEMNLAMIEDYLTNILGYQFVKTALAS